MTITAPTPTRDAHGNETSGAAERCGLRPRARPAASLPPDVVPAAEAIAADPAALPMGQVFMAYLMLMSTDAPDVAGAREAAAAARGVAAQRARGGPRRGRVRVGRWSLARRGPHARRAARAVADRRARRC